MDASMVSAQPSTAFDIDGQGFIIFPADKMSNEELISYLYDTTFSWFEGKFGISLTDEQKGYIRAKYHPTTARRALMKDFGDAASAHSTP